MDGGDCADPFCGDGVCNGSETEADCPEDCASSETCADCAYDFTPYGSECCDTAAEEYGLSCAALEGNYNWDCSGCNCPLDGDEPEGCADGQYECADGGCIPGSYYCDGSAENGNAGWGPDCADGSDEVLAECCDNGSYDDATCGGGGDDCVDTDNGATDTYGDGCAGYTAYPSWCGGYDDDDFNSGDMCCACGGGSTGGGRDDDVSAKPMIYDGGHVKKSAKNPADVIQPETTPLGRQATGFESKLQRATGSVKLIQTVEGLSYEADGYVGFEITLKHGADFEIDVTSKGFIADYNTVGNTTKVVVVNNETSELFSSTGDFEIVDVIAATTGGAALSVDMVTVQEFGLSNAYPNPFNPTTSVELGMPADGFVSVKIYNIMGQVVATLHEGNLTANNYSFTWDAVNAASGMYFLKAETAGNVDIQKIMFMK
jgi:hypothetical protein